jgi:hypothetical protein
MTKSYRTKRATRQIDAQIFLKYSSYALLLGCDGPSLHYTWSGRAVAKPSERYEDT